MNILEKITRSIAITSIVVGTVHLLLYYSTADYDIVINAGLFTLIAFLVNSICLLALVIAAIRKGRISYLTSMMITLSNIPIGALYVFLLIYFMSGVKVDFVNTTGRSISNVHISGCQQKHVGNLKNREGVSLWIDSNCDEANYIHYQLDGDTVKEHVSTYTDLSDVHRMMHMIGDKDGKYKRI